MQDHRRRFPEAKTQPQLLLPSSGSPRHYSSSLVWLRCVDSQWDVGRADQIRDRVLGGRQTETCPFPPWGAFTGVNPATIHKRTGHPGAISTEVVTNSPPIDFLSQAAIIFFYNYAYLNDVIGMNLIICYIFYVCPTYTSADGHEVLEIKWWERVPRPYVFVWGLRTWLLSYGVKVT